MKAVFLSHLRIEKVADYQWQLTSDLGYQSASGCVWIVPAGFLTDFASIPRFAWRLFPPAGGAWDRASVLHDYCYRTGVTTRDNADNLFYEALRADGVGWWTARTFYAAVRWFGSGNYKEKSK